jgi:predicted MPP superfamily phosphohydrolase
MTIDNTNMTAQMDNEIFTSLENRLGRLHARQRLGIENSSEPRVFGGGINFFHPENWYSSYAFVRYCLKLSGLYWRGQKNTFKFQLKHHHIPLSNLPEVFEGFKILHLSDLHVDMNLDVTRELAKRITGLEYDICVLTGDYRALTFGDIGNTLEGMEILCRQLNKPVYGILGNHDSIRLVPGLETLGIQMLLNESITFNRQNTKIHLAGIDDAHYFRVDNIHKAAHAIPPMETSILLSHTPEIYKQAAYADFDVMFCGHTHGGQICLPGGIPLTLDAKCPRYMGSGSWRYHNMIGYTSVGAGTSIVNVRLNCPPEITIHTLRKIDQ